MAIGKRKPQQKSMWSSELRKSGTLLTFKLDDKVCCCHRLLYMPRQSPIDTESALHHIITRGIERRKIFIITF
jgi:hypothetical protein